MQPSKYFIKDFARNCNKQLAYFLDEDNIRPKADASFYDIICLNDLCFTKITF